MVTALVMLNLAGGESVDDVWVLEKDERMGMLLLEAETHRMLNDVNYICRSDPSSVRRFWASLVL